jgi:hypothetical protein
MDLEHISQAEIPNLELITGIPIVYEFNSEGRIISKEILEDEINLTNLETRSFAREKSPVLNLDEV